MARKKQEIALQVVIETQEEWEEMLAKEGLTVVDVFQEWAGPCNGMVSSFRRLKNELGDDSLHFAVAKSDTIDSLEKYRGKCEPCFLFFAGGVLVAQMRGANAPQLLRMITEQLAYEHKVLEGNAERKEIKDPMLVGPESPKEEEDEEEEEEGMDHLGERVIYDRLPELSDDEEEQKKTVSVAIIKPNVVADGKVEEILEKIREAGIEILEHQEKTLTEEEAREFYAHKKDEEYFEDLIKFMTSGPSHVLVITKGPTGEGIIEEWRELLGPASVEEAKQVKPDSLRAKYGGDKSYVNALHGSDSHETAMRELAFFFPDFAVPTVPGSKSRRKLQRTLALIRPDALKEKKEEILEKIKECGFTVAMQKEIQLTREQAEEFYKEHKDEKYFEELMNRMTSGPLLALALAREDAVTGWKEMLGPKEVEEAKEKAPESLRAQFSIDDVPVNQLHGSESEELAQKELNYFFPMQKTVAVIKPDAYQTKEEIMNKIKEAGFHIAARKETELTKDIAEQFYKDQKDKEYFNDLTEHMTSGPTLFMVLTREDAVDGWRSLMGPTDPQKAKEENPDTLRAQFGSDVKANALHGSSSESHAEESMKIIFGELKFNPDGTVIRPEKKQKAKDEEKADESKEGEKEPSGEEKKEEEEDKKRSEEERKDEDDKKSVDGEKKDVTHEEDEKRETEQKTDDKQDETGDKTDEKTGEKQDKTDDETDEKQDKTDDKTEEKQDRTDEEQDKTEKSEAEKSEEKGEGERDKGDDDRTTDEKHDGKNDEAESNENEASDGAKGDEEASKGDEAKGEIEESKKDEQSDKKETEQTDKDSTDKEQSEKAKNEQDAGQQSPKEQEDKSPADAEQTKVEVKDEGATEEEKKGEEKNDAEQSKVQDEKDDKKKDDGEEQKATSDSKDDEKDVTEKPDDTDKSNDSKEETKPDTDQPEQTKADQPEQTNDDQPEQTKADQPEQTNADQPEQTNADQPEQTNADAEKDKKEDETPSKPTESSAQDDDKKEDKVEDENKSEEKKEDAPNEDKKEE